MCGYQSAFDDRMDVMEITWDNGNTTTTLWEGLPDGEADAWWHLNDDFEDLQHRDQLSKFDPSR